MTLSRPSLHVPLPPSGTWTSVSRLQTAVLPVFSHCSGESESPIPYKPECFTTAVGRHPHPPPPTPTSTSLLSFSPSSNCHCPNINPATAGAAIKRERQGEGVIFQKRQGSAMHKRQKIEKGGYPTSRRESRSNPGNVGRVLRG